MPDPRAFKATCPWPGCGGPFEQALVRGNVPLNIGAFGVCTWCDHVVRVVSETALECYAEADLTPLQAQKLAAARQILAQLGPPPRDWRGALEERAQRESVGPVTAGDVSELPEVGRQPGVNEPGMGRTARLRVIYKRVDAATKKATIETAGDGQVASCSKGCSNCCYTRTHGTAVEAELIVEVVRARGGDEAVQALGERAAAALKATGLPDSHDYFTARVPCPLLEEDLCSVYEVRPGNCRLYWVSSDPKFCIPGGRTTEIHYPEAIGLFHHGTAPLTNSGNLVIEVRDLNWQLARAALGTALAPWLTTYMTPMGSDVVQRIRNARLKVVPR